MIKGKNWNGRYPRLYTLLICISITMISLISWMNKAATAQNNIAIIDNNRSVTQPQILNSKALTYTTFLPLIQTPGLQVDDFEDGQDPNQLGGSIEWHGECKLTSPGGYDSDNPYSGTYGYRLDYEVTETCFAAWQTGLLGQDLTGYSVVVFQIKGAAGGETANVYLQNSSTQRDYVDIEIYLPMPTNEITTDWQKVSIPLSDFEQDGIVDLTNVNWFQIVFEWEDISGTVYIDDIRFE